MYSKFVKYWAPVLFWAVLIFAFSSMSRPIVEVKIRHFDKFSHLLIYAVLGYLLLRALLNYYYNVQMWQLCFIAIMLGTLYGISDELHQAFVPGRIACASDAVFDFFGSAAGIITYRRRNM